MKRRPRKIGRLNKQQAKRIRNFFNIDFKELRSLFGDDRVFRIFYKNTLIGKLILKIKGEDEHN